MTGGHGGEGEVRAEGVERLYRKQPKGKVRSETQERKEGERKEGGR
jgi:hypothetical protein